jgi:hypothetical protein
MQQQARDGIRYRIECGLHRGIIAKAFPGELVRELDLEHDAPTKLVPLPIGQPLSLAGHYEAIAECFLPGARRRRPVEYLD